MKRIVSFLCSFVLVLLLFTVASCGSNDGGGDVTVDASGNTIVKIMFHVDAKSAEGRAYAKRIDAFNSAYKDQKIKATAQYIARTAGASAYETDLMNRQLEGTLPDIITFDAPNCASYASSKLLFDITDSIDNETKNDFISLSKYNNRIYGLPIQESSAGFYYNKRFFDEAGINPNDYINGWTFEQFNNVCNRLKNTSAKFAVDMRLDATKDETATYLLYSLIYAAGGKFVSEDGYTSELTNSGTNKGFTFIQNLVKNGCTSYAVGATDFFDGKVGMYLSSGWTIPDLDNKYPTIFPNRDTWGLLPYPHDVTKASATGSWCFGVTNNGKKDKSATIELLKWMTSPESSKVITDATGMIPARLSVDTNYQEGTPEYVLYNQLQTTGKARPDTVGYPKLTTVFNQIINKINGGNVTTILKNKNTSLQEELTKLQNRNK